MRSLVHALCARVIFRILTGEVVKTVLVNDFDSKGLRVNIKVERLLRQFLERIEDNSVRDAEFAFAVIVCQFDGALDDIVTCTPVSLYAR